MKRKKELSPSSSMTTLRTGADCGIDGPLHCAFREAPLEPTARGLLPRLHALQRASILTLPPAYRCTIRCCCCWCFATPCTPFTVSFPVPSADGMDIRYGWQMSPGPAKNHKGRIPTQVKMLPSRADFYLTGWPCCALLLLAYLPENGVLLSHRFLPRPAASLVRRRPSDANGSLLSSAIRQKLL
ncbi:hypothetical protein EJ06DRAFT_368485 [Trichodelitschia bisporula]|uniref:Uncharacterized protein n=1 Tax=Trichodelitschia bisporula TaxID=703511 RepID=A0A6G1I1S7_9PEZI|nr:hypothetical protein EJ06DRAFT_368485 [Trichodelitschia bisporula]